MKRFSLFFFMVAVFTANVFAADANISRVIPNKNTTDNSERVENNATKNRSVRTVSRTAPVATKTSDKAINVVSRSVNNRKNNSSTTLDTVINTVGRSARTDAASINNNPSLRRAGITLRASTAEVGGRATIGNTGVQTGSNIDEQVRGIQSRVSIFGGQKQSNVTAESLSNAKDVLEKTSDLNNTCQQQYNECMDQFCAVVDTNQKRCSCSANLAKYSKVQKAVEEANTELNDVAQRIRYVGLSADEIRAILSATEAELEMSKTKDSTQTRSMLEDIAEMLKDPTSSTTLTSSTTADSLLDMDLDFSSDSSDLFSLDIFNASNTDISSKRGKALYNEAKKRCKTVLNRCKDAGGTENLISGNYDLAIDKDCVAYEQGLKKLNDTLKDNVRSANLMLQKARLAVLQNKNQYGIKECVAALENCMLDDMVCGEDYIKCVDPTKMFIDENGKVILGRNIANITNSMTAYNNTKINSDFIKGSIGDTTCSNNDGACIVNYLMTKIGMGATVKDGGLCRAVLDKCQDYTYVSNGKTSVYNPYNDVVVNYIQRAMVNIKSAQSNIISKYAANCMSSVQDCYSQQNSQITSWTSAATIDNIYKVLTGTCYNTALTCGYAVFAYDREMANAISDASLTEYERQLKIIDGISQMFYQTLLCPDNSEFTSENTLNMINERCACKAGYMVSGGACVLCPDDKPKGLFGQCVAECPTGMVEVNNKCMCADDREASGGKCVCPADKPKELEGECVISCPVGMTSQNNKCVCPSGLVYSNGKCSCPTNKPYDLLGECVASCPTGMITKNNKCLFNISENCTARLFWEVSQGEDPDNPSCDIWTTGSSLWEYTDTGKRGLDCECDIDNGCYGMDYGIVDISQQFSYGHITGTVNLVGNKCYARIFYPYGSDGRDRSAEIDTGITATERWACAEDVGIEFCNDPTFRAKFYGSDGTTP